ncbi:hypothetical protein N7456_005718 [Penicillium angulare]|uniref:Uncharacterized protein n=1 Tax=Penicillium angulare TaxID=116970 RepID=A0A9W9FYX9_9EURO|nr:hypothetical protein N7456_005718 [Penicillium angulare]
MAKYVSPLNLKSSSLESATRNVISFLATSPQFLDAKVLIIGKLANKDRLSEEKEKLKIEILIDLGLAFQDDIKGRPSRPSELLSRYLCEKQPKIFNMRLDDGEYRLKKQLIIQLAYRKSPYTCMPTEALYVAEAVKSRSLPYASTLDILMFSINLFTIRFTEKQRKIDIKYISKLLEETRPEDIVNLQQRKRREMQVAFEWFIEDQHGDKKEVWSRELGICSSDTQTGKNRICPPPIHSKLANRSSDY